MNFNYFQLKEKLTRMADAYAFQKVAIWGAGDSGRIIFDILKSLNIDIPYIYDSTKTGTFQGLTIQDPTQSFPEPQLPVIIASSAPPKRLAPVFHFLHSRGTPFHHPLGDITKERETITPSGKLFHFLHRWLVGPPKENKNPQKRKVRKKLVERLVFFLRPPKLHRMSWKDRFSFLRALHKTSKRVDCPHRDSHIVEFIYDFLFIPDDVEGVIVEAGCFKGGSTAKFSIAAAHCGRKMQVFDSFKGMPPNQEPHNETIYGESIKDAFAEGTFNGPKDQVTENIRHYGREDVVTLNEGWFEDSLPHFKQPVCAAYVDVDLASSTRTCLKYLYPLLVPGGVLYSHDGNMPLVVDVFKDDSLWEEIGCPKPHIVGLGTHKILKIYKPLYASGGPYAGSAKGRRPLDPLYARQ